MVVEKKMDESKNNDVNQDEMEAREEQNEAETAGLMTDMKLDDSAEEFRNIEPDFPWAYRIEIYPWHAADMTEKFLKLIQISDFSRVVMRKKKNSLEKTEVSDEKEVQPQDRQRMGCLQFYLLSRHSAKGVMRCISWKSMVAKELTVEITRRDPTDNESPLETAYMELNTYPLCKCRFREKATGELKDRSTRVSKIPGEITRGFLEVVLTRAYPVVGDAADKSFAADPMKKVEDIEDFNGILELDCLTRGSARSFVQAHKRIVLNGQDLTVVAVDEKTMVEPTQPVADPNKTKKKDAKTSLQADAKGMRGRGRGGSQVSRGSISRGGSGRGAIGMGRGAMGRGRQDFSNNPGFSRPIMPLMRPNIAPAPRNGPGMPLVPMTGRQKMSEKMRTGMRGAGPGSIGDTFKAEIAHLQNQLTESTKVLHEKIAMLQGHDNFSDMNAGYNDRASSYNDRSMGYNDRSIGYNDQPIGYNERSISYNDRSSSGFIDQPNSYNDRSGMFNDMTSGYDSRGSQGWSNTDYGYDSGYSKTSFAQHTSRMGESRGSGLRGGTRASKRGRW